MKHYNGVWGWITATFPAPKPGGLGWRIERAVTAAHVWVFQRTRGRVLGSFDGAPLLVLHSTGAKSGLRRRTPMIHLVDGDNLVVVASIAGNPKNPAWYYNLRAHPDDVEVDVRGGRHRVRARQADAAEAGALWPRLEALWPAWKTYQTRTDREFPVMILEPRS